MKTIAFHTLGCKVNQYDTEAMLESFERAGYAGSRGAEADVFSSTPARDRNRDRRSHKLIRRIAREHPHAQIVRLRLSRAAGGARACFRWTTSLVLGTQRAGEVVELFRARADRGEAERRSPLKTPRSSRCPVARHEAARVATMKIQEGCDRNCAYCIIPSVPARCARCRSRTVAEAKRLAQPVICEIVH